MDEIYHVQFVGGHADGTELAVIGLKDEFQFRTMDRLTYGNWNFVRRTETYVLLPDTTIYVFKRIE